MSPLELGAAIGFLVPAVVLLSLSRRRRERDALVAVLRGSRTDETRAPGGWSSGGRSSGGRDSGAGLHASGWRHRSEGGPRARAPTSEEVAASMVLLAVALQSGCGIVEAIEHVAQVAPPVPAAELSVVAAALRWGLAEERAWAEVDPRWLRSAMALRMARAAGVAPSSLLLSGAEDLRSSRLAALDVAAARLGVRLVVPLGLAFLPAFVLTTIVPVVLALARQVLAS